MNGDPKLLFHIFKVILFTENIMNFYQSVLLEKSFFENNCKKVRTRTPKIILKTLDYMCHKSVELQKNLKHFNFW